MSETPTAAPPASSPPPPATTSLVSSPAPSEAHPHSRRSTTALITAIAGLLSAIAAFQRTPPEETAKESYVTLQKAFKEQSDETDELRKEIVSLRFAFEAYARAKEGNDAVTKVSGPDETLDSLGPVEVRVQPPAPMPSRVITIPPPSRPTAQRTPLPDVNEIVNKASKK